MIKLCAIALSVGGLIGGVETVLDTHLSDGSRPEVAFSQKAPPAPAGAPPDPARAVAEALADAQGRDIAIADLFRMKEEP